MRITSFVVGVAIAMAGCFSKPDRVAGGDDSAMPQDGSQLDTPLPVDLCMPALCGPAGGTCVSGVCVIVHTSTAAVTCPAAMPCQVTCTGADACDDGVKCGNATECTVNCAATQCSLKGVDCGAAMKCRVRCLGGEACRQGMGADVSVECRASMCDVTCDGANACMDGVDVDVGGTCKSHCCNGACTGGTDTCANDAVCL